MTDKDKTNLDNLSAYMDNRGIPENERDELPFGDNPESKGFYLATIGHVAKVKRFLFWNGSNWINAKREVAQDVTRWQHFKKNC